MDSGKNKNISRLDLHQMQLRTLDGEIDAQRVMVVGQEVNVDTNALTKAIEEGMKSIKIEIPSNTAEVKEKEIQVIEVPHIVREVEKIEVPLIITEIKTIEIPVIVKEVQIVEVEKPIIVPEIRIVEIVKESQDSISKRFLYTNSIITVINLVLLILAITNLRR